MKKCMAVVLGLLVSLAACAGSARHHQEPQGSVSHHHEQELQEQQSPLRFLKGNPNK